MQTDPTKRFSDRVAYYIKYRPNYPKAVCDFLTTELDLTPTAIVADVGSGTGILSKLLLQNGNLVFGVEPNREMREAAEKLLSSDPNFRSVEGTAEATTLPDHSVDFITAGQAFHWFDILQTRTEFSRILKPGGWIILIWNEQQAEATPFMQAYEQLLHDYAPDYRQVRHTNLDDQGFRTFFEDYRLKIFDNAQSFAFEGLRGRMLSSSYVPNVDHPQYQPLLAQLHQVFDNHQVEGRVHFQYKTKLYYGHLAQP